MKKKQTLDWDKIDKNKEKKTRKLLEKIESRKISIAFFSFSHIQRFLLNLPVVLLDTRSFCVYYSTNTKYTCQTNWNSVGSEKEKISVGREKEKISKWKKKQQQIQWKENIIRNRREERKYWKDIQNLTTNEIINKTVDSKFVGEITILKYMYTKNIPNENAKLIYREPNVWANK